MHLHIYFLAPLLIVFPLSLESIHLFPESACEGFFVKSSRCNTSSHLTSADLHLHTFTSADLHLHTFTSADLHLHTLCHTLTPADLHLRTLTSADLHLHTLTPADLHLHTLHLLIYIFTPCVTPSHLQIYIFTPLHLLIYIFAPSHLLIYIFTPSHLLIYIFTPSRLQIYIFTPYICWSTSSHPVSHPHTCRSTSHTLTSADLHLHTFTSADLLSLFFLSLS